MRPIRFAAERAARWKKAIEHAAQDSDWRERVVLLKSGVPLSESAHMTRRQRHIVIHILNELAEQESEEIERQKRKSQNPDAVKVGVGADLG